MGLQSGRYSRDLYEEMWCSRCGFSGQAEIVEDVKQGDDSYMTLTCSSCRADQHVTFSYRFGEYEDIEFVGDVLLSSDSEEAQLFLERYENLQTKVSEQLLDNALTDKVLRKLCMDDLDEDITAIFPKPNRPNVIVVVSSDSSSVEEALCGLDELGDHKYSTGPAIEVMPLDRWQKNNTENTNKEDKKPMYKSTIKGVNPNNANQLWVNRLEGMRRDILLERGAMKNPNDFDNLKSGDAIRFDYYDDKGWFFCKTDTVEVIKDVASAEPTDTSRVEEAFIQTLNTMNYPFLYFDKTFENYSTCFNWKESEKAIGRPDFLLCKKGLGTYAVDVTERQNPDKYTRNGEPCITISKQDFKLASRFSRTFCLPWWWAVKNNQADEPHTWYMLSLFDFESFFQEVSKHPELEKTYLYNREGFEFICIPLSKARMLSFDGGDAAMFA